MVTYQSTQLLKQKITSFYFWIEAWNVYLAVCINHMPSQPLSYSSSMPTFHNLSKDITLSRILA